MEDDRIVGSQNERLAPEIEVGMDEFDELNTEPITVDRCMF